MIGLLGSEFTASFAGSLPSWFGILVYEDLTSKEIRNISSVMFSQGRLVLEGLKSLYGSIIKFYDFYLFNFIHWN